MDPKLDIADSVSYLMILGSIMNWLPEIAAGIAIIIQLIKLTQYVKYRLLGHEDTTKGKYL